MSTGRSVSPGLLEDDRRRRRQSREVEVPYARLIECLAQSVPELIVRVREACEPEATERLVRVTYVTAAPAEGDRRAGAHPRFQDREPARRVDEDVGRSEPVGHPLDQAFDAATRLRCIPRAQPVAEALVPPAERDGELDVGDADGDDDAGGVLLVTRTPGFRTVRPSTTEISTPGHSCRSCAESVRVGALCPSPTLTVKMRA
jgi:hypothetical protein